MVEKKKSGFVYKNGELIKHWPWLPLQFSDDSSSNRVLFLLPASTWHTDLTANNSEGSDVCCRAE